MYSNKEQVTENQHFVPKFYFKPFANQKKNLEIFDAERIKIMKARDYRSVCYEKFFYSLNTGEMDEISQQLEEAFRQMENQIAPLLQPIIKKILNQEQILDDEIFLLSTLMSMLWLRNPVMRKQLNKNNESMYKEVRKMNDSEEEIRERLEKIEKEEGKKITEDERNRVIRNIIEQKYSLTFNNASHIRMIGEMEGFRNLLFHKRWNVYLARGKMKFVTSDAPVVEIHSEDKSFWGNHFMDRKHYLALSPEILIETVINVNLPSSVKSDSVKRFKRISLYDKDENRITEFNLMIAGHCHKFSYSQNIKEFEDMIRKIDIKRKLGEQNLKNFIRSIVK